MTVEANYDRASGLWVVYTESMKEYLDWCKARGFHPHGKNMLHFYRLSGQRSAQR